MQASPFYLNYGQHPWTPLSVSLDRSGMGQRGRAPHADKAFYLQRISHLIALAKKHLLAAQSCQKAYADTKRHDVTFAVGDQVLLSTANLRLQGSRNCCPALLAPSVSRKLLASMHTSLNCQHTCASIQ